ncbi:953_t:CDS:2 [Acaulospora morrowiae]|uniref:953_t:CDS:1 n=1 Tax=Acaulospora morrowiae TaxID=94023 RepID=A0A9N8VRG0_9GLOM|nr:953_t:CDS:2 [Acaulospora morrowiae]
MTKTRSNSKDSTMSNGSAIFGARVTRSAARSRGEKLVELSREGVEVVQLKNKLYRPIKSKILRQNITEEEIQFIIDNDDLSDTDSEDSLPDHK